MENQRVSPHGYRPSIVSVSQAVGCDHETSRIRKDPDREQKKDVNKVAKIGQEVMVATFMISVIADGHEIKKL